MVGTNKDIPAYVYIYHLGLCFDLPTLPDSLTDNMPISFYQEPVLARSAPHTTFASAGPRTLNVTIKFHRHMFCLENSSIKIPDNSTEPHYSIQKGTIEESGVAKTEYLEASDVADYFINAMESLSLPKYTDADKALIPPSLLIRFGNEAAIRGVPTGFSKTSSGAWLKGGKMSDITLSFQVIETQAFSAQYVANNGSLRSISTDLQRGSVWQF